MKTIWINLFLTVCFSNPTFSQDFSNFLGGWCNNEQAEKTGEYVNLGIYQDENKKLSSSFSNGGPFEESHTVKLISDTKIDLYFYSVGGSISFNELQDSNTGKCKKTKLAECVLLDKNRMQITTFANDCSYLPHQQTIILKRLSEDQFCSDY
jgi:hypothetical protein